MQKRHQLLTSFYVIEWNAEYKGASPETLWPTPSFSMVNRPCNAIRSGSRSSK